MRRIFLLLTICATLQSCFWKRTGLKKYYTKISSQEFESYRDKELISKSNKGNVFRVPEQQRSGSTYNFLVFEKINKGERDGLFKMNGDVELKSDSTFIFYGMTISISSDSIENQKGVWFHCSKHGAVTDFSADSLPPKPPIIDEKTISPGIYYFENGKLARLSSKQTDEAFTALAQSGFYYLPKPGRLYELVNFNQIE